MDKELIQIAYMALGGILFALGGTTDKVWRRYFLPVVTLLYLTVNQVAFWKAVVSAILLGLVLSLGYGKKKPWGYRILVALSYSLPSMIIGLSLWQIILPVCFIVLFKASNTAKIQNEFTWKTVEFITGVLLSISFIGAL